MKKESPENPEPKLISLDESHPKDEHGRRYTVQCPVCGRFRFKGEGHDCQGD